jgi:hypothetical protein
MFLRYDITDETDAADAYDAFLDTASKGRRVVNMTERKRARA